MITQGYRSSSQRMFKIVQAGTITATPLTVPEKGTVYRYDVDTTGGEIDISNISDLTIGATLSTIEKGDEVVFTNIGTDNLIYKNGSVKLVLLKGDVLTLTYIGETLAGHTSPYIVKYAKQSGASLNRISIQAVALGQTVFTLQDDLTGMGDVAAYVGQGHRIFKDKGFELTATTLEITHEEYSIDLGETVEIVYVK